MSAVDDVVGALGNFIEKLEEADTQGGAAADEADKGRDMAAAVGHTGSVEAFGRVHDLIDEARQALRAVIDKANEARNDAEAIGNG